MMDSCRVITPRKFIDDRGFFCETWNRRTLEAEGVDVDFVQDNLSLSVDIGTVRGLHCQLPPTLRPNLCAARAGDCLMSRLIYAKAAPGSASGLPKN